jgi:hypothetical protein
MNKLLSLGIIENDIDSGLEYLPESLNRITCRNIRQRNLEAKVEKIKKRLDKYFKLGNMTM